MDSALNVSEHEFQKQTDRPPTSKTLFAMANILAVQGRDQECEFLLKRIIQENPRCLPAYNSLAELQMRQGKINAAIDKYAEPEVQFGGKGKANGCSNIWLEKIGIDGRLHPCDERGDFMELTDFNDIYGDGTMVTKQELDEY